MKIIVFQITYGSINNEFDKCYKYNDTRSWQTCISCSYYFFIFGRFSITMILTLHCVFETSIVPSDLILPVQKYYFNVRLIPPVYSTFSEG